MDMLDQKIRKCMPALWAMLKFSCDQKTCGTVLKRVAVQMNVTGFRNCIVGQ